MNIVISYNSDKPMYEQIEDGIKKAIYDGELKNHEMLPSVRQLAKDLNVSAITTKRAYIDLEHEGFVYTISGKGTFVKLDSIDEIHTNRQRETISQLENVLSECKKIGITKEKITDIVNDIYE